MRLQVDIRHPTMPSIGDEQRPHGVADGVVPPDVERPARRRRSAILGGGVLVAASPVAVGAGLFVPGFAALGLGALLLLLPPRERTHRSPLRFIRTPVAAGWRGVAALARGTAHVGARTFSSVELFAAGKGRDGAARIGRVTVAAATAVYRSASAAGSRGWSAMQVVAPRVWSGLVEAARSLARVVRSASVRMWVSIRPTLRRAWAACLAGCVRTAHGLAALARSASERLSVLVDSRSGGRQLRSLPPRAPRPPTRGTAGRVRRAPALLDSRIRSGRNRPGRPR